MRVAHVVAAPEFARLILAHELRAHRGGVDHVIVCSPGPDLDALEAEGFRVERLRMARKIAVSADLVSLWRLIRLLIRLQPDLVHTYTPKAGLLGQIAAAVVGIASRVHGCRGLLYHPTLSAVRRRLFYATDWMTCHIASRTLFVSRADLETLVRLGACPADRARMTGNGIDLATFRDSDQRASVRAGVRDRLGVGVEDLLLLTVGRFVEDKGYADLASAIPRLRHSLDRLKFVWAAPVLEGEGVALSEGLLAGEPLARVVTRLERQEDMRSLYWAADLLIHPSHREGTPRVLMEAAACGLPILASDISGNCEVVDFGRSAASFPARDPKGLAAALDRLLASRDAWASMASAARDAVRARMDVSSVAARVANVYRELGCDPEATKLGVAG